MFIYKPPAEVLDETLRKAFDVDHSLDDRFQTLLERLRMRGSEGREAT